jgi:hypothetical protein
MPFPIGAIFSGDPMGAYQKGKTGALDDQYSALAGKALQDMFQSQVPGAQPVPGAPIQGVQGVQGLGQGGPGGPQQVAGGPGQGPLPGGAGGGPQAGGGPGGGGNAFGPGTTVTGVEVDGKPTQGPPIGVGGGGVTGGALTQGPQVQTQSFQRPPVTQAGGQQQGGQQQGGQQPLGQGPLTLQQAIQSVVKAAGPRANPQLIFGAVNKMLPALNAQGLQQYRDLSLQIRENQSAQGWQRLQNQQEEADRRDQRFKEQEADKVKHWGELEKKSAQNMQSNQEKFQNALRNRQVNEARGAIADYDRQTSQLISEAANLGKPLPPEKIDEIHKRRQQMVDQADALRAQPQPGLRPPGGTAPVPQAPKPRIDLTEP